MHLYPTKIKYLCNILKPDISLITNISDAHIKHFKTIQNITNTKKAIFDILNEKDLAIVNIDDNEISKINIKSCQKNYSFTKKSDYRLRLDKNIVFINNIKINIPDRLIHLKEIILPIYAICSEIGIKHNNINKHSRSLI